MTTFQSARDAKEFLTARIVEEAKRENISLSEVERKMLYFSETHWTLQTSRWFPKNLSTNNDTSD